MRTCIQWLLITAAVAVVVLPSALAMEVGTSKSSLHKDDMDGFEEFSLDSLLQTQEGQSGDDEPVLFGPPEWGKASERYEFCGRGAYQSPIDIDVNSKHVRAGMDPGAEAVEAVTVDAGLQPFVTSYGPGPAHIANTGQLMQMIVEDGSSVEYENVVYDLKNALIHIPAEHTIDGERDAAEIQLVHKNKELGVNLVISVLLRPGNENEFFRRFIDTFPKAQTDVPNHDHMINFVDILPGDPNYWVYGGSITVPPCTEGTTMIVMQQRGELSMKQLYKMYRAMPQKSSVRPAQPNHQRIVLQSAIETKTPNKWASVPRLCNIEPYECRNGAQLDSLQCLCLPCPAPWGGAYCDECHLTNDDCSQNTIVDQETCTCDCSTTLNKEEKDRWTGLKCNKCMYRRSDCQHNGVLDSSKCTCDCGKNSGWEGDLCDVCGRTDRDCLHGGRVNKDTCRCERCENGWGGPLCEECMISASQCLHGGKFNVKTCSCDGCQAPWSGHMCEKCTLIKAQCVHGGYVDPIDCTCKGCKYPWGGPRCDQCLRTQSQCGREYRHHVNRWGHHHSILVWMSRLNSQTCQCDSCPQKLSHFEMCTPCNIHAHECQHASVLDRERCYCTNCNSLWNGARCNNCIRSQASCQHGGQFDPMMCMCVQCPFPWAGELCEECALSSSICLHGGKMDMDQCTCTECEGHWGGTRCDVCQLQDADCEHGGRLDTSNKNSNDEACKCQCKAPWDGPTCNVCTLVPQDCQHQGVLDSKLCRCMCTGPWKGDLCQECTRSAGDCVRGTFNPTTCKCEECPEPWVGPLCNECGRSHHNCIAPSRLDTKSCTCSQYCRDHPESGICGTEEQCHLKSCKNGGSLNALKCMCEGCSPPWEGLECDVCSLRHEDCFNGGRVNIEKCECECLHPWVGSSCDTCNLDDSQCKKGHGSIDTSGCTCRCSGSWDHASTMLDCDKCTLNEAECEHGGVLDKNSCKCICKDGFWGIRCERCPKDVGGYECGGPQKGQCGEKGCKCIAPWGGKSCSDRRKTAECTGTGMAHYKSFDKAQFDLTVGGEYVAYESDVDEERVTVLLGQIGAAAVTYAVGVKVRSTQVMYWSYGKQERTMLDCAPRDPKAFFRESKDASVVTYSPDGSAITITLPSRTRITMSRSDVSIFASYVPSEGKGFCVEGKQSDSSLQKFAVEGADSLMCGAPDAPSCERPVCVQPGREAVEKRSGCTPEEQCHAEMMECEGVPAIFKPTCKAALVAGGMSYCSESKWPAGGREVACNPDRHDELPNYAKVAARLLRTYYKERVCSPTRFKELSNGNSQDECALDCCLDPCNCSEWRKDAVASKGLEQGDKEAGQEFQVAVADAMRALEAFRP